MPTFEIKGPDGRTFEVQAPNAEAAFRAFQSLSPDQAQALANARQRRSDASAPRASASPERDSFLGKADAFMRGAADVLSFGTADEIAAGLGTGFGYLGDYEAELARQRGIDQADAQDRGGYRLGGQVAGGVTGGIGLAKGGLSLAANAAQAGGGIGRVAAGSAADGAILGALQGFGSGEGFDDRLGTAATGAMGGAAIGGVAPYAVAAGQAALSPLVSPIMSRLRPDRYASNALGEALRRAGMSADDVADDLARAQAAGQDVYTVADSMGHSGGRLLSTIARTPNEARQGVVEALQARQTGQGERLVNALSEGFGAPQTAQQTASRLTAARSADAARNYGAARAGAGSVDPTAAIRLADDFLQPGASRAFSNASNIADDSVEAAVRRARSYLTDGNSVLRDFNASQRAKMELDAMIEGAKPSVQRVLIPIRNALDEALANASPDYAAARDAFRTQSRVIDAIETGTGAASSRTRAADNIRQFEGLTEAERKAFRVGYADPMIARIEAASTAPTTNKARLLQTGKSAQEFPAFAVPGRADTLSQRIAREQRMFETANAALGGSRTADNLADAGDLSRFDPSIMMNVLRGRPVTAAMDAATRLITEAKGMPPAVLQRLSRALMANNPALARQLLQTGTRTAKQDRLKRAIAASLTAGLAGAGTARSGTR